MWKTILSCLLAIKVATAQTLLDERFPNLIIPVSSKEPDRPFGTQYSGHVAKWTEFGILKQISTELVFDNVPLQNADYCTIELALHDGSVFTATPSPLTLNIYSLYGSFVELNDTWNYRPAVAEVKVGSIVIENGQPTGNALIPCGEGKVQVIVEAETGGPDLDFTWFELNDPASGVKNGFTFKQWASP